MSNNKAKYDYGKCQVCGEKMKEKRIKQDFWLRGKLIVVESVPAGVCSQCGEKVVKADIGRKLMQNLEHVPAKNDDCSVVHYLKNCE
jgi:YgiT-type zinc finger domain-containing protein